MNIHPPVISGPGAAATSVHFSGLEARCSSSGRPGLLRSENRWRPTVIETVGGSAHRITVRWDLRQNCRS